MLTSWGGAFSVDVFCRSRGLVFEWHFEDIEDISSM
jgi:hypothetical protein